MYYKTVGNLKTIRFLFLFLFLLQAFAPKQILTKESDVNIEHLDKAISNFAVSDAITIHQILEKKNVGK